MVMLKIQISGPQSLRLGGLAGGGEGGGASGGVAHACAHVFLHDR